jgi:hypothetical protein
MTWIADATAHESMVRVLISARSIASQNPRDLHLDFPRLHPAKGWALRCTSVSLDTALMHWRVSLETAC